MTTTTTLDPLTPETASEAAAASSAHARINVPLNLENWKHLPADTSAKLVWFHQYALDTGMSWAEVCAALGYERSVVFRVLKGTYPAQDWSPIVAAITSFQRIITERGQVQRQEFAENRVYKLISGALNYALANQTITTIEGESRSGKSTAAIEWKNRNNHGRTVYIIAPAYGGTKALLRTIALAVGVNRNLNAFLTHDAIIRAFNANRILIIDEAHRLLPGDRRGSATNLEIIRDIHDRTGCAIALIATTRFSTELKKTDYMFEQLLGRIELPVRLHRKLTTQDVEPILAQYFPQIPEIVMEEALRLANQPGRLGLLVGVLKIASRMIRGARGRVTAELFFRAVKVRETMMGENQFAL